MRRIVAGIYDPLPTPTTVGSRGVTKVAFQNLFREISGLSARGEKKKREREREGRRKEEEEEKKKSRALAFDRALDRNAERSSLRAGSERPSPNCRQRDTVPPFFRFSFLPPILSLGQGARQMAHECPGCPVRRPRRQTF